MLHTPLHNHFLNWNCDLKIQFQFLKCVRILGEYWGLWHRDSHPMQYLGYFRGCNSFNISHENLMLRKLTRHTPCWQSACFNFSPISSLLTSAVQLSQIWISEKTLLSFLVALYLLIAPTPMPLAVLITGVTTTGGYRVSPLSLSNLFSLLFFILSQF